MLVPHGDYLNDGYLFIKINYVVFNLALIQYFNLILKV
jgi:hypothetical protein